MHAPDCILIYESGTIGTKPKVLPLSIGDGELAETADAVVSLPEIFNYWLQPGRIDVGFLGAAQIDRFGNINTTVIGEYSSPTVRLPGAGGAQEIAAACPTVIVTLRHDRRAMVESLDFVTSRANGRLAAVITDLGILEPGDDGELVLTSVHPGVKVDDVHDETGWELRVAPDLGITESPTDAELAGLRGLKTAGEAGR